MFAFLMAIGIVVDDAIVVSDNIERHRRLGKKPITAAIDGAVEVTPSVISSVMTTVITFLPLCFVSGVMGKFIAVMPFAFITALLMSLFESLLVLPGHLSHEKGLIFTLLGWLLYPLKLFLPVLAWLQRACDRGLSWFIQVCYRPLLDVALANRLSALAVAVSVLMLAVATVRSGVTPFSLFPKIDANRLLAKVSFPDGTPVTVTEAATRRIKRPRLPRVISCRRPKCRLSGWCIGRWGRLRLRERLALMPASVAVMSGRWRSNLSMARAGR